MLSLKQGKLKLNDISSMAAQPPSSKTLTTMQNGLSTPAKVEREAIYQEEQKDDHMRSSPASVK
jgi:hypothetical protein